MLSGGNYNSEFAKKFHGEFIEKEVCDPRLIWFCLSCNFDNQGHERSIFLIAVCRFLNQVVAVWKVCGKLKFSIQNYNGKKIQFLIPHLNCIWAIHVFEKVFEQYCPV